MYHFSLNFSILHVRGACRAYTRECAYHTHAPLVCNTQTKYSPENSFEEKRCLCTKMRNQSALVSKLMWGTYFKINCTSPIQYQPGSCEIEPVTEIHEQIEMHLNGCRKFALSKILVFSEHSGQIFCLYPLQVKVNQYLNVDGQESVCIWKTRSC